MSSEKLTVLLYCPDIGGHRHLYAARFVDYFLDRGFSVLFAYAGRFVPVGKGFKYETCELGAMQRFQEHDDVRYHSLRNLLNEGRAENKVICDLQQKEHVDTTFFVNADALKIMFYRLLLPWSKKLLGRNIGLFVHTEFIQFKKKKLSPLANIGCLAYCLIFNRGVFKDGHLFGTQLPAFNFWLFRLMNRTRILDAALSLDDLVEERFPGFVTTLAEVGCREWEDVVDGELEPVYRSALERYDTFVFMNKNRKVLLLAGDLENRKGYDVLIKAAAKDERFCVAQVGRVKPYYVIEDWEFVLAREKLIKENRLFEFNLYFNSYAFFKGLLSKVEFLVLPYRHFQRSSAAMIDAVSHDLPLIVSKGGVMAYRVQKYKLGRVFKDGDVDSLLEELGGIITDGDVYKFFIKEYACKFSRKMVYEVLDSVVFPKKIYYARPLQFKGEG